MSKSSWHKDGFVAEASHYDLDLDRVRYPANPMVGTFAGDILKEGSWNTLFAYLYRRFGPPNVGSDDHKQIACWCITTPMEGVHLYITIKPVALRLNFYLEATREVMDDLVRKAGNRRLSIWTRMDEWSQETFGEPMPATTMAREAREELYYGKHPDILVGEDKANADDLVPLTEAGRRAVQDLLRVVTVDDDNHINALGDVDGEDYPKADYCAHAGRWLPFHAYTDDMSDVLQAAEGLGGGHEGMRKVADVVRRELPEAGEGALERAMAILQRIVDQAPPDGVNRPHPLEYWGGVVAARSFLEEMKEDEA